MISIAGYPKIVICILLIICPVNLNCFKLSASSALIAYNTGLPSNYTLEVTGSRECFDWYSSNPRIILVTPLFQDENLNCSKKAILSSIADLSHREATEILVKERSSGKKLYFTAYTDRVKEIELDYISDELFVDATPERLSVIAKDNEGHIFTSTSGLEIKWEVSSDIHESVDLSETDNVIRLSRFDESDYMSPEGNEFETRGLLSSTVLVEPLQIGTAVVTASLLSHGKPVLRSKDVKFKVLPNLIIKPSSPLYLVRHGKVNVSLEKFRSEDKDVEFTADVEDSSIVAFNGLKEFHAKQHGSTSVKIHSENSILDLRVHVVKVARIGIRVSNGGNNILQELTVYEFFVDLFDEEENKIYCSENLRVDVKFPPKLFHIIYTSPNGTYFIVQTTAPGRSKIRAEFKGIKQEDDTFEKETTTPVVTSVFDVSVRQRLSIFPPFTLLPITTNQPMHKIHLKASGGNGNYIWSLSNYEVAKIIPMAEKNNSIELEIYSEIYSLIITVTDLTNLNFISKAEVSCQTPIDLEVYPTVVEAEIGNYLIVPVALLGYEDRKKDIVRKFDDCSEANITIDIVDPFIISYEKEAYIPAFGKGCKSLQFKCKAPGHTRINLNYSIENARDATKNKIFKTTTVLACYKKLKPVYPVRVGVVALGTSMEIAFEGGPRIWPLYKEGHFTELLPTDPELVTSDLIYDPIRYNKDLTVFKVLCRKLGENTLTLRIGNKASATLPHPAHSEESIKFICSEPDTVNLKLFKKKSNKKLDDNVVKVPFYGEKIFEVDIYIKDKLGRKFANISSLRVAWDSNDKSLAYPVNAFDFESHENAVSGYRKLTRNFMTFKMRGGAGDLKVEAKVTSYRKDVLEKAGIKEYKELKEEIIKSIDLKLVSLRDINNDLYQASEGKQDSEGYCENDSCKS